MKTPLCTVWTLFIRAVSTYAQIVHRSGWWILTAVVWQEWAYTLQWTRAWGLFWTVLCGVVNIVLWTQALRSAAFYQDAWRSPVSAQRMVWQYLRIITMCMVYFFMFYGASHFAHTEIIRLHSMRISSDVSALTQFIVLQAPSLIIFFFSALTVPVLIIHGVSIWAAFLWSMRYVLGGGINHIMFLCVLSTVPAYVQLPNTRHSMWLAAHHLKIICDLCVFFVCAPLVLGGLLWIFSEQKKNSIH